MRDAFGGAFSIKLMLIFLILYVSFICVALNYARAFRVKNRIINIVEQYEGYDGANQTVIDGLINGYLIDAGYKIFYEQTIDPRNGKSVSSCLSSDAGFATGQGYCVKRASKPGAPEYYLVETYMSFTLPILNVNLPIAIKGETRVINDFK